MTSIASGLKSRSNASASTQAKSERRGPNTRNELSTYPMLGPRATAGQTSQAHHPNQTYQFSHHVQQFSHITLHSIPTIALNKISRSGNRSRLHLPATLTGPTELQAPRDIVLGQTTAKVDKQNAFCLEMRYRTAFGTAEMQQLLRMGQIQAHRPPHSSQVPMADTSG